MNHENKQAVIYCRASPPTFDIEDNIKAQEKLCRHYAEEKGYKVEAVYIDRIAGHFFDRPAARKMLDCLQAGVNEEYIVLTTGPDRLSRETKVGVQLFKDLNLEFPPTGIEDFQLPKFKLVIEGGVI